MPVRPTPRRWPTPMLLDAGDRSAILARREAFQAAFGHVFRQLRCCSAAHEPSASGGHARLAAARGATQAQVVARSAGALRVTRLRGGHAPGVRARRGARAGAWRPGSPRRAALRRAGIRRGRRAAARCHPADRPLGSHPARRPPGAHAPLVRRYGAAPPPRTRAKNIAKSRRPGSSFSGLAVRMAMSSSWLWR